MDETSTLGVGLYSLVDAARLLKTPRRTISRWVEGYVCKLRDGQREYAPVIFKQEEAALSFGDLVELMYTREFRKAGVELDSIRKVGLKYREAWNTPYPLATKRFINDGRDVLLREGEEWKHALTGQLQAYLANVARELIHTGDFASEWRPLGPERTVVLHPDRSFGKPIDDLSGAHTYVLAQALLAGQSPDEIAWWFGTSKESVLDAVEFENEWKENPSAVAA